MTTLVRESDPLIIGIMSIHFIIQCRFTVQWAVVELPSVLISLVVVIVGGSCREIVLPVERELLYLILVRDARMWLERLV
jgi:hypothetical protein